MQNVTVAGVTGAIGPALIPALQDAGFNVQCLTRSSSTRRDNLGGAKIVSVDYRDQQDLRDVLTGQDAVISVLGDSAGAVAAQAALIEASVAVGVKRFIPSEFGSDTFHPRVRSMPFFVDKLRHQALLQKAAEEHPAFSYSIIITGPFLDWGLSVVPFIVNVGSRDAQVFDGGDVPFSTTRLPTLCQAVIATLRESDSTRNQTLYIHDAMVTQNQLLDCAERLNDKIRFTRTNVDMQTLEHDAWHLFGDPTADPLSWIFSFINLSMWSREQLCAFRKIDNEMLGVKQLCAADVNAVIEEEIQKAINAFGAAKEGICEGFVDSKIADKAFLDGKQKLVGFCPSC